LMNGQLKVVDYTDNDKADYAITSKSLDSAAEPTIKFCQ
jgi:hypothetical protein